MTRDQWILWIAFLAPAILGIIACKIDVRERRIPNWISVSLLASGLLFNVAVAGGGGFLRSISGFAAGFALLFVLYAIGGGGAGDVKFMGGVGAWIGPYHILFVFVLSAIFIAVYAMVVLAYRLVFGPPETKPPHDPSTPNGPSTERSSGGRGLVGTRTPIPYAVPATLAIAVRLVWLLLIHRNL